MTPLEAAELLERMEPAALKLHLVELLEWQVQHGKALVHIGWYLRCLQYQQTPRYSKRGQQIHTKLVALSHGIGGQHG